MLLELIFVAVLFIVCSTIVTYREEIRPYCYIDESCYYCDYANPKYHIRDNDVECPFYPLNRDSETVRKCEYREQSCSFKEWLLE